MSSIAAQAQAARDEAQAIAATADSEGRDMTVEELDSVETYLSQAQELDEQAEKIEKVKARLAESRKPKAIKTGIGSVVTGHKDLFEDDPLKGFADAKDMIDCVIRTRGNKARRDDRLSYLAAAGSDEQNTVEGQYGGFMIPKAMVGVKTTMPEGDPTAATTTDFNMESMIVSIAAAVDKDHSTSVSGGLIVGRKAEMAKANASRANFEEVEYKAQPLFGLNYQTRELLEASPSTVASILSRFPAEFASKEFNEKLNGNGVTQMEGINICPAMITVAKESAQTKETVVVANLAKMMSRCYQMQNAVWLINHDVLPQIIELNSGSGGTGANIFQPSAREGVNFTLYGLPLYITEYVSSLGQTGDLMLVNMREYLLGEYGGLRNESSYEVRFIEHEQCVKFYKYNDGRTWWRHVLTPKNGATKSPFVRLGERAT
jgi:HK97 family phage major capsid protein